MCHQMKLVVATVHYVHYGANAGVCKMTVPISVGKTYAVIKS